VILDSAEPRIEPRSAPILAKMNDDLIYRDECYRIIGACLAVHKDKGNGFAEPVYQDALEIEMELTGIPFDPQRNYPIQYRGRQLRHTYTPDLNTAS
jgi:hypothetical protein